MSSVTFSLCKKDQEGVELLCNYRQTGFGSIAFIVFSGADEYERLFKKQ